MKPTANAGWKGWDPLTVPPSSGFSTYVQVFTGLAERDDADLTTNGTTTKMRRAFAARAYRGDGEHERRVELEDRGTTEQRHVNSAERGEKRREEGRGRRARSAFSWAAKASCYVGQMW